MQIEECNDGTYTCSTCDSKNGDMYGPSSKREKTTHPDVESLKGHIDKHFGSSKKKAEKKEPKLSELNDRFNKLGKKK